MNSIIKYLDTYAEPETPKGLFRSTFFPIKEKQYQFCVVVPLYGEASLWLEHGLKSLLDASAQEHHQTLIIAVINRHELSEPWIQEENDSILKYLERFPKRKIADFNQMNLFQISPSADLLALDHNTEPYLFHSKEGVGKARKVGCDLALALATTPHLRCKYIHTTDGDAVVDKDYFEIETTTQADILLHPYVHVGNYEQMKALKIYENSLRYYVTGLKYAKSPYAHESLGSTIATTPDCYAKVRGFPKRNAAEDFYFLNKAVKVGKLHQSEKGLVKLIGRKSHRVPFGTGVGTEKVWQTLSKNEIPKFYDPKSFEVLKNLIFEIEQWSQTPRTQPDKIKITQSIGKGTIQTDISKLKTLLETLGFFSILETAKLQRKNSEAILKHCHESWDGFKTLKFIHGLRDNYFPEIEMGQALIGYEA
ncbi:hypothetical protein EBQ74_06625 [bacterium]|nr:hypothetical protein [bacterium]